MNDYKTRAELKGDAKDLLRGRWKDAVLLNLIPNLILLVVVAIAAGTIIFIFRESVNSPGFTDPYTYDNTGNGGGSGGTFSGLIGTLISTGISFTLLDWYRQPSRVIRPLRDAFQVFTRRYLLGCFLIWLLISIFTFLWALLLIIPGIIKSIAYSQAYFIYKDWTSQPENGKVSALDCITESRRLMDGHKMDYFMLQLSFIGWGLVGLITLGIGFIWIIPYMNTTFAIFYDDLSKGQYYLEENDEPGYQSDADGEWENF